MNILNRCMMGLISNERSIEHKSKILLKIFANTIHHLLWLAQNLKFPRQSSMVNLFLGALELDVVGTL